MAGRRINGGIIGVVNSTSNTSTKGVWSFTEQVLSRKGGNWPKPPQPIIDELLIIAGGGGGGSVGLLSNIGAGAGGAGGYRTFTNQTLSFNTEYTVTIGAGGSAAAKGSNSVFHMFQSTGGGVGGGG